MIRTLLMTSRMHKYDKWTSMWQMHITHTKCLYLEIFGSTMGYHYSTKIEMKKQLK